MRISDWSSDVCSSDLHPDVSVIVNHMGMPVASDPAGVDDWRQGMQALAANTHVVTKISGVGFIDRRWTVEQIRPLVLETIEIFGADRCLFASDFPTDKLFGSFDQIGSASCRERLCQSV